VVGGPGGEGSGGLGRLLLELAGMPIRPGGLGGAGGGLGVVPVAVGVEGGQRLAGEHQPPLGLGGRLRHGAATVQGLEQRAVGELRRRARRRLASLGAETLYFGD